MRLQVKCVLLCVLMAGVAIAAQDPLRVSLVASKVVQKDGKTLREPAERALPGEVIEYVATYQNTSSQALTRVSGNLPVPSGMEYLPGTEQPTGVLVSSDGNHFSLPPLKRQVKSPSGAMVEEVVPPSEYRFLRWDLGTIAPGQSKTVRAQMKVQTNAAGNAVKK